MYLKIYAALILITAITTETFAQKQNVYFLKDNNKKVSTRDSADFIQVISEPDSGDVMFNIHEYYPNGKIKLIGKTSYSYERLLDGQCLTFYPSGKRQQIATYFKGNPIGDIYDYYPNGKLYRTTQLLSEKTILKKADDRKFIIKTIRDSSGKVLLNDGTGYYISYSPDFKQIYEQGMLKNNLKDSVWTGLDTIIGEKILFKETYKNGKFLSGQSTNSNGIICTYKQRVTSPEFRGGDSAFNIFLSKNIKYPEAAARKNVQGKVFIQFTVDRDGSLVEFKVLRDPGSGLGDEGIRVLKLSPKWKPGFRYGVPVQTSCTVPINFSHA